MHAYKFLHIPRIILWNVHIHAKMQLHYVSILVQYKCQSTVSCIFSYTLNICLQFLNSLFQVCFLMKCCVLSNLYKQTKKTFSVAENLIKIY